MIIEIKSNKGSVLLIKSKIKNLSTAHNHSHTFETGPGRNKLTWGPLKYSF